jgi:thiol-disulfide isomerase/thioredoxin
MDKAAGSGTLVRPLLVTALAAVAGFAAVYVTLGRPDNAAKPVPVKAAAPPAAPAATAPAAKLNVGEVAAFVFKKEPEVLAEISFVDGEGKSRTLKDWQGRVVLLNLWATWCAPCRKEMPGLARLQREMGSAKFEVVALAVDRAGADAAKKFLDSIDANGLALYVDATARSGTALRAVGMPTTILVDAQGREIGRLTGPAEWDTAEAKRLVAAYTK